MPHPTKYDVLVIPLAALVGFALGWAANTMLLSLTAIRQMDRAEVQAIAADSVLVWKRGLPR